MSLDGFMAGPNGEMNWIRLDEKLFDDVHLLTQQCDTALYGRVTFEMMDQYWPTAGEQPDASKHDKDHSAWYKRVPKVVLSRTLTKHKDPSVTFLNDDIPQKIKALKAQEGQNILLLGSPSAGRTLMQAGLIDEVFICLNPIILGKGISYFPEHLSQSKMELLQTKTYDCGVVSLHYQLKP